MEVASPINFNPGGTKRSMACSPMDETMSFADISGEHRVQKRRKFHNDTTVESLSSAFSIHSPFINHDNMGSFATQGEEVCSEESRMFDNPLSEPYLTMSSLSFLTAPYKRHRNENNCQDDTSCIIEEQKKEIDTLKAEKADVEASLRGLTQENERITKEIGRAHV